MQVFHHIGSTYVWSEDDLINVSDKHGGSTEDGRIGRGHDGRGHGSESDERDRGRRHVLESHGKNEFSVGFREREGGAVGQSSRVPVC